MKFRKVDLLNLTHKTVLDIIVGRSINCERHHRIFEEEGKFYQTFYNYKTFEGSNYLPYRYDGDEIECDEMIAVERIVIDYVKKVE